jgi:AAA domain
MSIVINLLGGSGLGKSTTAALVFGELKLMGHEAELVQEYAKEWAWEGRRITPTDQPGIGDEQYKRELRLYNKVQFIITDSPLILGPMYQKYYNGQDTELSKTLNRIEDQQQKGISHMNFLLTRNKKFNPKGRFETEEQAKEVDGFLRTYLEENQIPFHSIFSNDRERVQEIITRVLEQDAYTTVS